MAGAVADLAAAGVVGTGLGHGVAIVAGLVGGVRDAVAAEIHGAGDGAAELIADNAAGLAIGAALGGRVAVVAGLCTLLEFVAAELREHADTAAADEAGGAVSILGAVGPGIKAAGGLVDLAVAVVVGEVAELVDHCVGRLADKRARALQRTRGAEAGEAGVAGVADCGDAVVDQPVTVVVYAIAGLRRGGRDGRIAVVAVGEGAAGAGAGEVAVEVDAEVAIDADPLGVGAGEEDAVLTAGAVGRRRTRGDADAVALRIDRQTDRRGAVGVLEAGGACLSTIGGRVLGRICAGVARSGTVSGIRNRRSISNIRLSSATCWGAGIAGDQEETEGDKPGKLTHVNSRLGEKLNRYVCILFKIPGQCQIFTALSGSSPPPHATRAAPHILRPGPSSSPC